MDNEIVILKVIVKTTRKSIDSKEEERVGDKIFNIHEGNTAYQNDRIIGKIIREIITDLIEKSELPF